MATNDLLKRLLDSGVQFSQMSQDRAQAVVNDLVRAGQVRVEDTQSAVRDLLDRGRENTERMMELVQTEVARQMSTLRVATMKDLARLEAKVDALSGGVKPAVATATKSASTTKAAAPAKKAPAKKAPAKKATAKPTAKKAPAKATSKKAPAKAGGGSVSAEAQANVRDKFEGGAKAAGKTATKRA